MQVERGQDLPPIALKTLTKYCGFYNAHNQINGSNQTTNLGVRSSNLFGRATSAIRHRLQQPPTSSADSITLHLQVAHASRSRLRVRARSPRYRTGRADQARIVHDSQNNGRAAPLYQR